MSSTPAPEPVSPGPKIHFARDNARDLASYLGEAAGAARDYHDRAAHMVALGLVREGDESYLANALRRIHTALAEASASLALLDEPV